MCFPTRETHFPSDMRSSPWETRIPSDMCSPTWETHIPSDMCSPPGKHIPYLPADTPHPRIGHTPNFQWFSWEKQNSEIEYRDK